MSKQSWKGSTLLAPVPAVMVSCGTMEEANILTVAWTGIVSSQPPRTYISLRPERYSYDRINKTGEFVINLSTKALVKATDFCGVRSGRDYDKFEHLGLTKEEATQVACPMIAESPLNMECRVFDRMDLGSHHLFLADILAVNVEETLLSPNGKLCLDRAGLISYTHGEYFAQGDKLGSFGYTVRKKKKKAKKRK